MELATDVEMNVTSCDGMNNAWLAGSSLEKATGDLTTRTLNMRVLAGRSRIT